MILAGIGVPGLRTMAASARPKLTPSLDAKTFGKWYWEVKELVAFLREQGLSSTGLKADLTKRVREFLSTGDVAERRAAPGKGPRDSAIPGGLKLSTPVKNYNNDAATRSFFEKHLDGFRFNEYLRGFARKSPMAIWLKVGRKQRRSEAKANKRLANSLSIINSRETSLQPIPVVLGRR